MINIYIYIYIHIHMHFSYLLSVRTTAAQDIAIIINSYYY